MRSPSSSLDHAARRPATDLSGGEQQRLALARALVLEPPLLLLDEPLSNLDARLRDEMRFELKRLQRELGVTALYVTHDQSEALGISNVVGVMRAGRLEQVGTPREIYDRPASRFVADFIGAANVLDGVVEDVRNGVCEVRTAAGIVQAQAGGIARGQRVALVVRPEHVRLSAAGDGFRGTVVAEAFLGETVDRVIRVGDLELRARSSPSQTLPVTSASRCRPRHAWCCRRRPMELRDLRAYGRYAVGLRRFLREPLTAERGHAMVARGVERRGESFLTVLERGVYRNPSSPFLPLLRRAGVELGDVAALVPKRRHRIGARPAPRRARSRHAHGVQGGAQLVRQPARRPRLPHEQQRHAQPASAADDRFRQPHARGRLPLAVPERVRPVDAAVCDVARSRPAAPG